MKTSNESNKVYTVIVTYNSMKWIKECLDSVIIESTVVVVDNLSTDQTVSFIKENYDGVVVLEQQTNLGFGKGNNLGIDYALENYADYVLLLNQDAKLELGSIGKLVQFAKNNSNYGIISPIHCDWSGQFLESSFSKYVNYKANKEFYSDFVLNKSLKPIYDVPFIAAACWFMSKEAILAIGGFDPIFFHLGEDVNYAQRLTYHGYKIGVLPNINVYHDTKDRVYPHLRTYSEDYFYRFNYRNKIIYADLNLKNWKIKLNYNKRQVLKEVLASLLTLRYSNLRGAFKQYKEFGKIREQCEKSRAINKEKGSHYLNYKVK